MNATSVSMPAAELRKRYGLYPAKIGSTFVHRIGIAMPLGAPQYSVASAELGATAPVRTKARVQSPLYEYGPSPTTKEHVAVKALPGAPVQLDVQDLGSIEIELQSHVKWACSHPECTGKRWASKQQMRVEHGDEAKLRQSAEQDPRGGQGHCYYGVIEVAGHAGKPEQRDGKGAVTAPAVEAAPTTVMICSDEE